MPRKRMAGTETTAALTMATMAPAMMPNHGEMPNPHGENAAGVRAESEEGDVREIEDAGVAQGQIPARGDDREKHAQDRKMQEVRVSD